MDLEGGPRLAFVASHVGLASGLEVGDRPNHRQLSFRPTDFSGDVYPAWAGLPVSDVERASGRRWREGGSRGAGGCHRAFGGLLWGFCGHGWDESEDGYEGECEGCGEGSHEVTFRGCDRISQGGKLMRGSQLVTPAEAEDLPSLSLVDTSL